MSGSHNPEGGNTTGTRKCECGHTEAEHKLPDRTGCVNTLSVHVGNYTSVRMGRQEERGP
jgi:hypothetical protein